jgi:hypothetical protein
MRMARALAAVLAAAAVIGVVGWHHRSADTPKANGAAEVPIAGAVLLSEVGGGIPSATSSDAGLLPISSVPVLVRGVTVSGRRLQRRLRADRHGRFRLNLPPGSYTFTAILDQGSTSVADRPNITVRVRVGQTGRPMPVRIIDTETVTKIV